MNNPMILLTLLIFCLGAFPTLAGELTSGQYDFCTVEGHPFQLGFYGPNWTGYTKTNAQTLNFLGEGAENVPGEGLRRVGTFTVGVNGTFGYQEIKRVGKNSVQLKVNLDSESEIRGESLAFQLVLPLKILKGQAVVLDGKKRKIGASLSDWRYQTQEALHNLIIPMERGTLSVSGKCRLLLQDNRRFGSDTFSLRLLLPGFPGKVKKTSLQVNAHYQPYPVNCLRIADKMAKQSFGGIAFLIIKGKGLVAGNLKTKISGKGAFLYLVSSTPQKAQKSPVGHINVTYADGSAKTLEVVANNAGEIFFDPAKPDKIYPFEQDNGTTLYLTRIGLGKKTIETLDFFTDNSWLINGVSLAEHDMQPHFKEDKYVVRAGKDWVPYCGGLDIVAGSALDFSQLLDAPAGKYGYLKTSGANFVFDKRPEQTVRFWGTNLSGNALFMSKNNTDRLVKRLARSGYNLLRIHHFDGKLTTDLHNSTIIDPERIDKLDYLLATCKKYGIYISLDLFTSRKIRKGEIADFPERQLSQRDYKALLIVNDSTMRNFEAFVSNLLTHRNAYTGLIWAQDPVIANISLINEGVLNQNIRSDFVQQEFKKAFTEYQKAYPATTEKQFKHIIYAKAYQRMTSFIQNLGVKVPITDLNYTQDHLNVYFDRRNLDYVDIHYYWAHPDRLGVPRSFRPDSALNNFGGVSSLFGARFLDRPFAISEWSYVFPNAFRSEGGFLAGAYFSLQGYSMPCRFNYASNPDRAMRPTIIVGFEQVSDPVALLGDRAGALFYLRNDVSEAEETCAVMIENEKHSIPPEMQVLGLIYKTGCVFDVAKANQADYVINPGDSCPKITVPQFSKAKNSRLLDSMTKAGILTDKLYNQKTQKICSSTGQIFFDTQNPSFKVLTPCSEGFIANPGHKQKGNFAEIDISGTFSSVLIASIDKNELKQSKRLLLLHLTDCQNSDMRFSDSKRHTVENYGKKPVLLRRGKVKVELQQTAPGKAELYALALSGQRLKRVPTEINHNKLCFTLDNSNGVFAYELLFK
jgi:hypothetical protein